jgi:N-acetylmuramoyl-L-alanine amidase CwlA
MKHQDFAKKYCPHRTLDKGWNRFIDMVEAKLAPAKPAVKPVEPAKSFFTSKGYFSRGDRHENINKVSVFMRRVFPSYTSAKAIGSLYGPYIEKAIKTFQKNAKKAGRYNDKVDGKLGPKTLRALETYGFRY